MAEPEESEFDFDTIETTSSPVVSPASQPTAMEHNREQVERSGFLGTGLRAAALAAILAVSTLAFFFWGGALWRAQPGSSHVARIAWSYLIVVPLVAAALRASRRLSAQRLLGAVAALWSAKLVITATSYTFIAPGSATEYAPLRTWESRAPAPLADPSSTLGVASPKDDQAGLSGTILAGGVAVAQAAVVLGDFEGPTPAGPSRDIPLAIERSRYDKTIYVARSRDRLLAANRDGVLHTIRFRRDESAVANIPVPPGPPRFLAAPSPGAYQLSCENHASERALLVVVDHELVALTDSEGRFEMRKVHVGRNDLTILREGAPPVRRSVSLAEHRISQLAIEIR